MIQDIKAIDMHNHINSGTIYDEDECEAVRYELGYVKDVMIGANIEKTFCSTYASVKATNIIEQENELMKSLCAENDFLYQWVVIDPRVDSTFVQAREILETKKCVGIKLHPLYHEYTLDEYGDKVFAFASEYSAIVLIHPERVATHILPMADKYPDVKFIMAHLNGNPDDHIAAVKLAKNGNVYTDTATAGSIRNRSIEYAVSQIGSERILFGTDSYAAGFQRGRIEYALISEEDKANILRYNAERLFSNKL